MEVAPESGLPLRLEGVYTPTVPGRGKGSGDSRIRVRDQGIPAGKGIGVCCAPKQIKGLDCLGPWGMGLRSRSCRNPLKVKNAILEAPGNSQKKSWNPLQIGSATQGLPSSKQYNPGRVRNFLRDFQATVRNKPGAKFSRARNSQCEPPPPPVCGGGQILFFFKGQKWSKFGQNWPAEFPHRHFVIVVGWGGAGGDPLPPHDIHPCFVLPKDAWPAPSHMHTTSRTTFGERQGRVQHTIAPSQCRAGGGAPVLIQRANDAPASRRPSPTGLAVAFATQCRPPARRLTRAFPPDDDKNTGL